MAILVEQEKNRGNILGLLSWLLVLLAVGLGVYYIFFKRPEIVELATPAKFANIEQLLKERIKPNEVLGNPRFKALQQYVEPLEPTPQARENPFLGTF